MLLLAIPMYAAPFVLISVVSFAIFLAIPRVRPYAFAALVAPVAFGGCAAAGFIGWVLIRALLFKMPLLGMMGAPESIEALVFFVAPGVLGASLAVWFVNHAIRIWRRLPIAPSWRERIVAAQGDY